MIKTKSILCVFAHPDDEYFVAGLLSRASRMGIETHLLCCTKGEGGKLFGENNVSEEIKIETRTQELENVSRLLNVTSLKQLNYCDGKSDNWDVDGLANEISSYIERVKPNRIITFGADGGINNHRDHKKVSEIVCKIYKEKEYIDKIELYFTNFLPKTEYDIHYKNLELTSKLKNIIRVDDRKVTSILELNNDEYQKKINVIELHKSQFPDINGKYYYMEKSKIYSLSKFECFTKYTDLEQKQTSYDFVNMI